MARNASGTHSLPSGNPVVTGTSISSTVHNNTQSDISTEITDSLSRSGKGAMLAPLELTDGSVGTPSLSFDTDTDCGLYRIGANNPALAAGGAKAQEWTATGTTIPGTAAVTGAATLGSLSVTGATALTGNATASGTLAVSKKTTMSAETAATSGTRQDAATLANGDLDMSGVANPASTTSITNRLTPLNLPKAWGSITGTGSAGAQTVHAAFNITSVTAADSGGSGVFTITFAGDMAGTAYAIIAKTNGQDFDVHWQNKAAGSVELKIYNEFTSSYVALASLTLSVDFVVFGAQ